MIIKVKTLVFCENFMSTEHSRNGHFLQLKNHSLLNGRVFVMVTNNR